MEIKHISHEHPLILKEEKRDLGAEVCYGCEQQIWSSSYGCAQCDFFLHKSCAELPMERKNHPMHPEHPLSLLPQADGEFYTCDVCEKNCERFHYFCSSCYFCIHTTCVSAMDNIQELVHISHEHPFILKEEQNDAGAEVSCYVCEQPIWGSSYGCVQCDFDFILHKSCAELPMVRKNHPMHPKHPLYLRPEVDSESYPCAVCGRNGLRFRYFCYSCDIGFHTTCVSAMDKIQHTILHDSHEHPLMLIETPAVFFCFACGTEHGGASYLCTTCGTFWINQKCASRPSTVKSDSHHHPLSLTYSLPPEYLWVRSRQNCDICAGELNRHYWIYYCAGCRYFCHLNCASSNAFADQSNSRCCGTRVEDEDLESNLIKLPLADESVDLMDLMTLFIKNICILGKYNKASEINHFSHDHRLIFIDKKINDELCSEIEFPLSNAVKNYYRNCNGCAQPILAPFYRCIQCDFSLHEDCAELVDELQHPCHVNHPLHLIAQQTKGYGLRCDCCFKFNNVFMFGCSNCRLYLDLECASLPKSIKHDVHKGALGLKQAAADAACSACDDRVYRTFVFACDACNFILCRHCTTLPSKFRHRLDVHPFVLTYSPIDNHLEEYFCEICENDINPKLWYYHCVDCDKSLHTKCTNLHPDNRDSNVKFGGIFEYDRHPHSVTFVKCPRAKAKGKLILPSPPCDHCGLDFDSDPIALECGTCDFRVHYYNCAHTSSSESRDSDNNQIELGDSDSNQMISFEHPFRYANQMEYAFALLL